jgi:hypothetical protein
MSETVTITDKDRETLKRITDSIEFVEINGKYRYTSVLANDSESAEHRDCEVCGKPATKVYQQTESRKGRKGWTISGYLFGHKKCLRSKRKE